MFTVTRNKKSAPVLAASFLALGLSSSSASALVLTPINSPANVISDLVAAFLAPASGITVIGGTETFYQGTNTASFQQSGTYTGFFLAPSSGSTPTLILPDGAYLTSGNANIPLTNTLNEFAPGESGRSGSGPNAALGALSASAGGTQTTFDANVLSFDFTVAAGNSVSIGFVFGTDEFPTQSVTDIFGFFVDDVNYAKFSNGQLISNTPGNPTNFISNPVGSGLVYGIEYNGLTRVLTATGALGPGSVHNITIGIADTFDDMFDSGVFLSGLTAGTTSDGCTGIGCTAQVPEPGTLPLIGLALLGVAGLGFRKRTT